MYARTVEGRVLTFGVSGKLVRNSLIMYDRETHSLWSHLTGSAIDGPFKGAHLDVVTATQTTWSTWRHTYPNTKVLPHDFPGQVDTYQGYFAGGDAGILGRKRNDQRLPAKAKVAGVRLMDHPKAYALDALQRVKSVDDTLAGEPLVVVSTGAESASVFRRDVNGQTLSFEASSGGMFRDRETGSTWDPLSGRASSGPLSGTTLTPIPSTTSFWFGWFDFFPGTDLWNG